MHGQCGSYRLIQEDNIEMDEFEVGDVFYHYDLGQCGTKRLQWPLDSCAAQFVELLWLL
jgi:hypothetical protein